MKTASNITKSLCLTALLWSLAAALLPAAASQNWVGQGSRLRSWSAAEPADRVRLSLRHAGLYRVTAAELATAGGWDGAAVVSAIGNASLSISSQGQTIAWLPAPDGESILFYGLPANTMFAPENVYWVTIGSTGQIMPSQAALPPVDGSVNEAFTEKIKFQGTNYPARQSYSSLTNTAFVGHSPLMGNRASTNQIVRLPDVADGEWQGSVTVELMSYYEGDSSSDNHEALISLDGTLLGTATWWGESNHNFTFPFSSTNLSAGATTLTLKNDAYWSLNVSNIDYTRFICISYSFEYQRRYLAQDNRLLCRGGSGNTVTAGGFGDVDLLVLDVTDPATPQHLTGVATALDPVTGLWEVSFAAADESHRYYIASTSTAILEPSVRGVRNIDWGTVGTVPRMAILIPPTAWKDDFRAAVQPLADYRNANGVSTAIIDVEDIYNSFSHGLVTPYAIQAFVAATRPRGLEYLLLTGVGSLDYRHLSLQVGDARACMMPAPVAGQRFYTGEGMLAALDPLLGDADGDGLPDIAVGRLPDNKPAALAIAVAKTIAFENGKHWQAPVALAADWNNTGAMYYPFSNAVDRLVPPLEDAGKTYAKHYILAKNTGETVKAASLLPAFASGVSFFHFLGHSNEQSLADGKRLLTYVVITPANWQQPLIAILAGCRSNRWQSITTTKIILPYGLFAANTGFVAGIGATGDLMGSDGEELGLALFRALADSPGIPRLGDLHLQSLRAKHNLIPPERLLCFSLLGDPSLRVGNGRRLPTLIILE